MKSNHKYDPEDIESLMLHKQFHELYPEEKEFVLRHLENEEEYNSMRNTLFEIKEISSNRDLLSPDAGLKKELLRAFQGERKSPFIIWLNSLFAAPDRSFFGQRGVQLSFSLAVIAIVGIFIFNTQPKKIVVAENRVEQPKESNELSNSNNTVSPELKDEVIENNAEEVPQQEEQVVNPAPPSVELADASEPLTENAKERMVNHFEAPAPMAKKDATISLDEVAVEESESVAFSDGAVESISAPTTNQFTTTQSFTNSGIDMTSSYEISAIAVEISSNLEGYSDVIDLLFTAK